VKDTFGASREEFIDMAWTMLAGYMKESRKDFWRFHSSSKVKYGWLEGEEEKAGPEGEVHIESYVENNEKGWTGDQIWGFAVVEEKRYYVRRAVVKKGAEVLKVRLVYNWQGKK